MKKDLILYTLAAIGAFGLAILLMRGTVQEYIYFADPINEMAMCVVALFMGSGASAVVISEIRNYIKNNK
jgi:uncharacterized protein YneF (UPF0154 family)